MKKTETILNIRSLEELGIGARSRKIELNQEEIDGDPTYSICTESNEDEEETKTSYDESVSNSVTLFVPIVIFTKL